MRFLSVFIFVTYRVYGLETFGDRGTLTAFGGGCALVGSGLGGGGFAGSTYLRTSQCRCSASINRSSSPIEVWVWRTRPGKSRASSATAWLISGRRSAPVWTFFTAALRSAEHTS